jgi:long-chain acyl-CoA synthetase
LTYSLTETLAKAIFLDPQLIPSLLNPLKSAPHCQYVIYNGEPSADKLVQLKSAHPTVTILSYDELLLLGTNNPVAVVPPEPSDLACIMYTSGSTGVPKGVLLTHRNVIAAVSGAHHCMGEWLDGKGMRMLAYLPTAHIYGFVFELTAQYWGSVIGYARIRTLTETSVRNCKGDLQEFRPQFLTSYLPPAGSLTLVSPRCGN